MKNAHIIGVGNHKGGVCKTTNCIHMAAALGERGRKCLVVDLDPNLGLTMSFDVPPTKPGTFHMLMGEERAADVIISNELEQERGSRPGEPVTLPKNVDIIPASRRIENFDEEYAALEGESKYTAGFDRLLGPISEVRGEYDYIFLDTAPSSGTLTIAAYKTASWFILSSTPERLSVEAMSRSLRDIAAAASVNPRLSLLGVVMSQVDARRKLERAYIQKVGADLAAAGGYGVFETYIPSRAVLGKSSALCVSLFDYEPSGSEVSAVDELRELYRNLAREIEDRVSQSPEIVIKEVVKEVVNG